VLTQQRSRSRGRLFGRGDDNAAAGGGGRSPSAGSWDGSSRTLEDARAEGSRRHEAAARRERALAYASACQQRHHDDRAGLGLEWLERWMAAQAHLQHAPGHAAALAWPSTSVSEKAVEAADASLRSPASHAHAGRPPAIPGYMVATRSARAKARSASPSHARSRSGGGNTSSSGQNAVAIAGYSPDSSFTGDWTPPRLGVSTRPSRVAYT
jgi:hypothetical protein